MMVHYQPYGSDTDSVSYEFIGDKIVVTLNGVIEEFDFTGMPNGRAGEIQHDILPMEAIYSAERIDGILNVEVVKFMPIGTPPENRQPYSEEVL